MYTSSRFSSPALLWIAAIAAALVGAAWLYDSHLGLNWFLFVLTASAAVAVARTGSLRRLEQPLVILLGWAILLALGAAITASEGRQVLILMSDAMLLGLAMISLGERRWKALSAALLPTVPFLAPARVWRASLGELVRVPSTLSTTRSSPRVRGILLALPLGIAMLALLRDADPVLSWVWTHIAAILPDWSISGRAAFFFFLLSITLGATSLAAHEDESRLPAIPRVKRLGSLGLTEQRTILITLAVILWLFVLLQVSYLIHPPPTAVDSGVTFAEYARRGFAELSIAVTLAGAVLIALENARPADLAPIDSARLRKLKAFIIVALELVLLSAFRRVLLYEAAYGFTTMRLHAQAYMIVIAISLVVLWLEIRNGHIGIDLGRRIAVVALGMFTVLVFWNHEAWIVNRNFDRIRDTGKIDARYLFQLSPDAVPTILARRGELPEDVRASADNWTACKVKGNPLRWFEYNHRFAMARMAVDSANVRCAPTPPPAPPPDTTKKAASSTP